MKCALADAMKIKLKKGITMYSSHLPVLLSWLKIRFYLAMKILKLYVDVELIHTILVSFIYVHLGNNKEIFFIILLYSTGQVVCLFLSSTSCQRFALYKTYRKNLFNFHRHILYIEYISVLIKRNYILIHQIPTQELKHSGKSITTPPPTTTTTNTTWVWKVGVYTLLQLYSKNFTFIACAKAHLWNFYFPPIKQRKSITCLKPISMF